MSGGGERFRDAAPAWGVNRTARGGVVNPAAITVTTPLVLPERYKFLTGKTLPEHAPQEEPRIRKKIAY